MENKDTIYVLEQEYIELSKKRDQITTEMNFIRNTINEYKKIKGIAVENEPVLNHFVNQLNSYPDYPRKAELIDKLKFIESVMMKGWWRKKEMTAKIEEIEGSDTKTLNSLQKNFETSINNKDLIMVRYSGSNILTFYTTNPNLVEKTQDGHLRAKPESHNEKMKRLTEEEQIKAEWRGI